MIDEYTESTVGQLVANRPSRSRVFEKWGIDYCCGGKKLLAQSCQVLSIEVSAVLKDLAAEEASITLGSQIDWTTAPLSALITNIVNAHHAYLREALPRLSALTEKVSNAHSRNHPELTEVTRVFAAFRQEMESHARKEEEVLFPYIAALEGNGRKHTVLCGSLHRAIAAMESEHEEAGAALDQLRSLTKGYTVPEGACATYRAMLDALATLEADTHIHVHKENSILFPRAEALELSRATICGTI
jgi:regulator of cell morphogenesis and NO signaling